MRLPFLRTKWILQTGLCLFIALLLPGEAARTQNVGELFPADTGAPLQTLVAGTGMPVASGSEVSAGIAPARFRLARGGQVRICPRTTVGVNTGGSGLMLTMGAGAVEMDYRLLAGTSDVLLTPDFSVRLAGAGEYHFALGVDKKGGTCFKSLPGNRSLVVLSELLGSGVYKAGPGQGLVFSAGKLSTPKPLMGDCGCPLPPPTMVATRARFPVKAGAPGVPGRSMGVARNEPTAPLPADKPGQIHIEVDTPFVFNARNTALKPYTVARINFSNLPNMFFPQEKVDPVVLKERPVDLSASKAPQARVRPPGEKQEKTGFLGSLKRFFGSIFHRH